MKKIKGFQCNIKKDKVYAVFFKPEAFQRMRKHTVGYVHKKFTCSEIVYWGFSEITDGGEVKLFEEDEGMTYEDYIKDFMDYDYSEIDIYEFNSFKDSLLFIKKRVLLDKLSR